MNVIKNKFTAAQLKAINREVRRNVADEMQKFQIDQDALWLYAIQQTTGFGAKRLARIYKAFFGMRREFIAEYGGDGFDAIPEIAAKQHLHGIGVDVDKLYAEFGEAVTDYRFTKGETQAIREARQRAAR